MAQHSQAGLMGWMGWGQDELVHLASSVQVPLSKASPDKKKSKRPKTISYPTEYLYVFFPHVPKANHQALPRRAAAKEFLGAAPRKYVETSPDLTEYMLLGRTTPHEAR